MNKKKETDPHPYFIMYHPEEVHLAKQVEYEYQDMANNVDDLKFARPRQENFIKIAFVRVRRSRSFRLSVAAAILLITMLMVILIWLALKQHDGTLIRIQSSQQSTGIKLYPQINEENLIKFSTFEEATFSPYTQYIDNILEEYKRTHQNNPYMDDCDIPGLHRPNRTCIFWRRLLGNCIHLPHYGYAEGRPCVLLSLDLPENVIPTPLEPTNPLVKEFLADTWSQDHVPVTCSGKTDEDDRYLIQPDEIYNESVTYDPHKGYSLNFFPRTKSNWYQAPLVMVQFNTLRPGTLINVQCTVWANYKNSTTIIQSTTSFKIHMN